MKFSCFPGGDSPKSWAQTKFEAKPVEISPFSTERTIGAKNSPCPNRYFRTEIGKFRRCQSRDIIQAARACQVSNPTDILSQIYGLGYFGSQKQGKAQNPLCHAHIPNFIGFFCSCGGSNRVLKIRPKFTKPISCENATKFGAQNFNGSKKEN